jgi:hypothetical protein
MKKLLIGMMGVLALSVSAFADMDLMRYSISVTGAGTAATNSITRVMRGHLEAVRIQGVAASTGVVTVVTDQGTVFTKTVTESSDATWRPRIATHDASGNAYVVVPYTNAVLDKVALAGNVKVQVISTQAANTNHTYIVDLLFKK